MGLAQDFRNTFEGIQFYLAQESGGVGKFRSDYVVIPEEQIEIYFEIIVSLKDNFYLPQTILIQDVYNSSEQIHDVSRFQNVPIKTHILYNKLYEKEL